MTAFLICDRYLPPVPHFACHCASPGIHMTTSATCMATWCHVPSSLAPGGLPTRNCLRPGACAIAHVRCAHGCALKAIFSKQCRESMRPSMQARRVEFLPLGGTYIHVTNKLMYVYVYVTSNKRSRVPSPTTRQRTDNLLGISYRKPSTRVSAERVRGTIE